MRAKSVQKMLQNPVLKTGVHSKLMIAAIGELKYLIIDASVWLSILTTRWKAAIWIPPYLIE